MIGNEAKFSGEIPGSGGPFSSMDGPQPPLDRVVTSSAPGVNHEKMPTAPDVRPVLQEAGVPPSILSRLTPQGLFTAYRDTVDQAARVVTTPTSSIDDMGAAASQVLPYSEYVEQTLLQIVADTEGLEGEPLADRVDALFDVITGEHVPDAELLDEASDAIAALQDEMDTEDSGHIMRASGPIAGYAAVVRSVYGEGEVDESAAAAVPEDKSVAPQPDEQPKDAAITEDTTVEQVAPQQRVKVLIGGKLLGEEANGAIPLDELRNTDEERRKAALVPLRMAIAGLPDDPSSLVDETPNEAYEHYKGGEVDDKLHGRVDIPAAISDPSILFDPDAGRKVTTPNRGDHTK